jgi:HAMP domain-containing protein
MVETRGMPPHQLLAWRKRALEQQLPTAGFPAGAGTPSLVYLWAMTLVAITTVAGFAFHDRIDVPAAVRESQLDLTGTMSRSLNGSTGRAVADLDRTVARLRAKPPADAELLAAVVGDRQIWSGAALITTADRRQTAAVGVALPFELLPGTGVPLDGTTAVTTGDGPALIHHVRLDDRRSVLAMQPLLLRNQRLNPDAKAGVFMITPGGTTTLVQGVSAVDPSRYRAVFGDATAATRPGVRTVAVAGWTDKRLVLSVAPVGDTGVRVASLLIAPVVPGPSVGVGLLLGGSLLAIAALCVWLMGVSLVKPLRIALHQGKRDACGIPSQVRQGVHVAEPYRVASALAVVSGSELPRRRLMPSVLQGLGLAAALGLLWPVAAVGFVSGTPLPPVPAQLGIDEESRAENATAALGNAVDNGLRTVVELPVGDPTTNADAAEAALKQGLEQEHRLRNLYIVDGAGRTVRAAGREPLRLGAPVPVQNGVALDTTLRRLPLLYAHRALGKGYAVVGEFDVDNLLAIVRQVDGRARVVDSRSRVVLDSEGFRAYEPLDGALARELAAAARPGGTIGRTRTADGGPALIAASRVQEPASAAALEWVVVVERDVAVLHLPEVLVRRWTLLVGGTAAGVVLLTFAWQFLIFVKPLRQLAAVADQISAGSLDAPVPPQRHDDIGALAMCLEICRQVRHTGTARYGCAAPSTTTRRCCRWSWRSASTTRSGCSACSISTRCSRSAA